ncbi:cupin domain-containing protein [Enterovibrio norvegicus]|uniref:Cupin n=1 Tax=Enterovibrio norvegicus TaxID=188144 RepID=A0A2N7L438_9GAMM|nr:cupin domain-containing protein [Enterovibrio norvegicus]PMN88140.1 cupin [Enterovibrio norvegicus]
MKQPQWVRFGDLIPCRSAFIDAHTPGSDQKENFTIIGGGVSESPDQHIHIQATPGFNIGAAGQPPRCFNSLHSHNTAEVFFVLKGRWRFFWGETGEDGEVVLEEGDIFNIPTRMFRGFENIGSDYGMIMSILGGDDAGGGVIWAPHVRAAADAHGLVLGESGRLYDTEKNEALPTGESEMPLPEAQWLNALLRPDAATVVKHYVARYWDMVAMSAKQPVIVIGENGLLKDKPGFEVDFLTRSSLGQQTQIAKKDVVLMVMRGHWVLAWEDETLPLNPGDTVWLPEGTPYTLSVNVSGEASLFRVTRTEDAAGLTWTGDA